MPKISESGGPTDARVEVQEPIEAPVSPQERPGEHGGFHADRNATGAETATEGDEGDYENFTKDDLAQELERRGLPKTGTKAELVDRLTEDDAKGAGEE